MKFNIVQGKKYCPSHSSFLNFIDLFSEILNVFYCTSSINETEALVPLPILGEILVGFVCFDNGSSDG